MIGTQEVAERLGATRNVGDELQAVIDRLRDQVHNADTHPPAVAPPLTPIELEQRRQIALALSRWLPGLVKEMAEGMALRVSDPLVAVGADGHLVIRLERK